MKPAVLITSAVVLAVAASALTTRWMLPETPAQAAPPSEASVRPSQESSELEKRLSVLERSIAELAARPTAMAGDGRQAPDEIERVVRRLLEESRGAELAAADAVKPEQDSTDAAARALPKDTASLLALLEDPALGEMDRQLLWEKVRNAGRIDEVVASYEAAAAADPNSPEAQVQLGNAYLQKLFQIGDGPVKGMVAMQADAAFNRALEIDPTNWEARFTKAVSLSHWPPVFGKQAEAISHFEKLVEQQRNLPPSAEHVHTYLLLGNLYQQNGKGEQAQAVWKEGLEVFPGNPALADALSNN